MNYFLGPFEGEINLIDYRGLKFYLQVANKIKGDSDQLDTSV